jgi:hypothetical protein
MCLLESSNTTADKMLSVVAEEAEIFEAFGPHVDADNVPSLPETPTKKLHLKTYNEVYSLLHGGKLREVSSFSSLLLSRWL